MKTTIMTIALLTASYTANMQCMDGKGLAEALLKNTSDGIELAEEGRSGTSMENVERETVSQERVVGRVKKKTFKCSDVCKGEFPEECGGEDCPLYAYMCCACVALVSTVVTIGWPKHAIGDYDYDNQVLAPSYSQSYGQNYSLVTELATGLVNKTIKME